MQEHHIGVFCMGLIEFRPDPLMIVEIHATGKDDLGTGGDEHFGLGAPAG